VKNSVSSFLSACLVGVMPLATAIAQPTAPLGADTPREPTAAQLECITEEEVVKAQQAWGEGIVNIGRVYSDGGDYVEAAADHINRFYAYDMSTVLFKPTLAADDQFRLTFDGALSYFVGGNESYPEDSGFAIKPWERVRWKNAGITNNVCHMAVAMGNYFFTPTGGGPETKVEYTIGYIRDREGDLRMTIHKSTIPYSAD
jgi:hypothetical protein